MNGQQLESSRLSDDAITGHDVLASQMQGDSVAVLTSSSMEATLNTDRYKQRLLAKEQELEARRRQVGASARAPGDEPGRDSGDESVNNERKEEQFRDADADWTVLNQVREALQRIEDGTFGQCLVDGEAIEEKRLEAIPWTPYCLKHQQELEGDRPPRMPTL